LDQPLSDDILNQLAIEDALAEDFYQLSLYAMTAADNGVHQIKLRSFMGNKANWLSKLLYHVDFMYKTHFTFYVCLLTCYFEQGC